MNIYIFIDLSNDLLIAIVRIRMPLKKHHFEQIRILTTLQQSVSFNREFREFAMRYIFINHADATKLVFWRQSEFPFIRHDKLFCAIYTHGDETFGVSYYHTIDMNGNECGYFEKEEHIDGCCDECEYYGCPNGW